LLILDHQVSLITNGAATGGGTDAIVHAEHAQLMRENHQTYLLKADATYGDEHSTSDDATITFRPDGSAEHIDSHGHVHLTTADGAEVHSSVAQIDLNAQSQPAVANLLGGVTYESKQDNETMHGTSVEGTLTFASAPIPPSKIKPGVQPGTEQVLHHAQFRNAVNFVIQRSSLPGDPSGSATREMRASTVDVDFRPGENNKALAQHALGVGGAEVKLHDIPSKGPAKTTIVNGDQLLATIEDGRELRVLDGKGNTRLTDISPEGAVNSSTGDTLHMTFVATPSAGKPASSPPAQHTDASSQVDTAVQVGNVVMVQTPAPGAKNSDGTPQSALHATAHQAEYHASDQVLHLTGDPHLRNDTMAITADKVDYHRDTGDASAIGDVKSIYVQQVQNGSAPTLGGDGPVHVTADHALLTRSTNMSVFYGARTVLARMWQGGDAVAAPVLELGREQDTLDAHGGPEDYGPVVHATFGAKSTDKAEASPETASTGKPDEASQSASARAEAPGNGSPSRVTSVSLHYSDKTRRADFHGSVTAIQPTGTVRSEDAEVFLTPAVPGKPSELDHMVSIGHVVITQPGRRGTGDRLVYTASDERYVLTGRPGQPPRAVDAEKGTTTGAALIFRGTNDSVEVADHVDGAPAEHPTRTITDTRSPH
jgi:lipopolysaccharide export system protein LptA